MKSHGAIGKCDQKMMCVAALGKAHWPGSRKGPEKALRLRPWGARNTEAPDLAAAARGRLMRAAQFFIIFILINN